MEPRSRLGGLRLRRRARRADRGSSTTPRCRRSAATRAAACCSSGSARVSAPPWSTMARSSRSSWRTCPIAIRRSRTTPASAACVELGEDGVEALRSSRPRSCSAGRGAAEYVVLGGGNVRFFARAAAAHPPRRQRPRLRRRLPRSGPTSGPCRRAGMAAAGARGDLGDRRGTFAELFEQDPERAEHFTLRLGRSGRRLLEEPCHRRYDDACLRSWRAPAGVEALRDRMFAGERDQQHRAARGAAHRPPQSSPAGRSACDGRDVMPDVQRRARSHARVQRRGSQRHLDRATPGPHHRRREHRHRRIGSRAGDGHRRRSSPYARDGPRLHFVSNVDGAHLAETLRTARPATPRSSSSPRRPSPPRRR